MKPKSAKAAKSPKPKRDKTADAPNRTFAIRITDEELAAIHRAAGARNASRFIRGVAAAFAKSDPKAFEAILAEAKEARAAKA